MKLLHLVMGVLVFSMPMSLMAADVKLKTDKEKASYTIGMQIGQDFKSRGIEVDADALAAAIKDVLAGKEPRLTREQMMQAMQSLQSQQMAKQAAIAEENLKAGQKFMAENKKKKGVKTLSSGIQYQVIKEGSGPSPKASDSVVAHYRGTLIDGKVFDSSYDRNQPATFPLSNVIPGWQEVLPMMKVGSKWKVFIPSELAYGEHGAGGSIGPNETLIFDIELIDIK